MAVTTSLQRPGHARDDASVDGARPSLACLPRWTVVGGGLTLLGFALCFAFCTVFARMLSLDEGYLMITVRGFLEGNALYDPLFTQYGPAYYLYQWIAKGVLNIPLTHDATRWMCLFHWLVAAMVLGIAGWRLSGSPFAGLFVFVQSAVHLNELANEPGHPQELVIVLLALGVFAATYAREKFRPIPWLAFIAASLFFIKINVGVFFGFALALTLVCESSRRCAQGLKPILLLLCLGIPFLLMRRHLGFEWCRSYAAVVAVALGGTCLLAWRNDSQNHFPLRDVLKAATFFLVPSAIFVGVAVLTGTSTGALLNGLILTPLQMPALVLMPLPISGFAVFNAIAALAAAAFVMWRRPNPNIAAALKLIYGFVGAFVLVGKPSAQLAALLPWVWLTLLPTRHSMESAERIPFSRLFLCFAAGAEALQAYPVAGTQIANGTILLVVTYALCLNDVLRSVSIPERIKAGLLKLSPATMHCLHAFAVLALVHLFANVWCNLPSARRTYAAASPLNLSGSKLVRMQPGTARLFQDLSAYLRTDSDCFISYPCVNSLYFWTEQRPPTQLNGTGWLQFDHAQQRQILDTLLAHSRPRLVLPSDLVNAWSQQPPAQLQPLVECITQQCEPVKRFGPYTVFAPKAAALSGNSFPRSP